MKILLVLFIFNFCMVNTVRAKTHGSHIECRKDNLEVSFKSREASLWSKVKGFFKVIIRLEREESKVDREAWILCIFRF